MANTLESYTLDEEGNRIVSHDASFHVTDPANRVSEDENWQFEYDVNGNLVRKTFKSSGLTWRYGYSVYDELVSATQHNGPDVSSPVLSRVAYTFDALGRRVAERKFDGAGTQTGGANVSHDGEHLAHEVTLDGAGTAITSRWYTHTDATDDLVSLTLAAGIGTISPTATVTGPAAPADGSYYVHTDHQGSVRALTDDLGNVVNHYTYSAYGETEELLQGLPQRFRFTAREYDAETGLMHYRARAYDPATGRFLQEDPIWFEAGDLNVYRYVWNNPVNWVDPSGLAAAIEDANLAFIAAKALLGGEIADEEDFQSGESTARFLEIEDKNALSAISGGINCALFTLADLFNKVGTDQRVVGTNGKCGVEVAPIELALDTGKRGGGGGSPQFCPKMDISMPGIVCLYQCPDGSIILGKMQIGGFVR